MDIKEGEFGSFIIIEEDKKENTKKINQKNLKSSKIKNDKKKNLKKTDILIYDEKTKKNKIISDEYPKEEIENSFLKQNDFCIYSKNTFKKEKSYHNKKEIINDDFENNRISKLYKIEEEKEQNQKRSDSFDFNPKSSSVFFNNIQKKNNNCFEDLSETKKYPDPMKADCILYDKKNNAFKGIIKVDIRFKCSFLIDKNFKNNLYYNDDYYIFSLLEIKKFNTNKDNCVEINLKDERYFFFKLKNNFKQFIDILDSFATPTQTNSFYKNAFLRYKEIKKKFEVDGWKIYNFDKEFKRQGIDFKNTYRILNNDKFDFCSSYPKKIIVPNMEDEDIKKCAIFRTKKRMPALTYRHQNGFCIWRSSQTKGGIFMAKNDKDVICLTKIAQSSKKLIVYDARPYINAMANKIKGAGYENINNYPNIKMELIFCGIANIHEVRSSYEKILSNISYNNEGEYSVISNLPNTFWYETIILILKAGFQIYDSINDKCTVLIHCSDGWDRTSQLSAISQLLLDKYYRTLEGFICLIEKDWLSFGHQFQYRNGFYSKLDPEVGNENQFSPIFIQWLDSVYQLMSQNYSKFEFNFNLLSYIASEVYCGKYGTFLFNNEKEREAYKAKENTISLWSMVMDRKKYYLNPIYDPSNSEPMSINYKKIKLWEDYFYRFEKGEKKETYLNLFNKVIDNKQKLIEEMIKIIADNKIGTSELSKESQKEIEKYIKSNVDLKLSFEILELTPSIIKLNQNK